MRVLLRAYTQLNLGDDLFLHILSRRYPQVEFVLARETGGMYGKFLKTHTNISDFPGYGMLYRLMRRAGRTPYIDKRLYLGIDAAVYIGGSIFMENESDRFYENMLLAEVDYCAEKKIPYYILSCNFGPYQTDGYVRRMRACFEKCADVCFRDTASHAMFARKSRFAADAVFSTDIEKPPVRENVLGVSIISYKNRAYGDENAYMAQTERLVREHLVCGGAVELFCFCTSEGDFDAAGRLAARFDGEERKRISIIEYDGDVEAFVGRFISCGRIYAARFHAIMLALIYRVPLICHIYSEKTANVLRDMGIFEKINPNEFTVYDIGGRYSENLQIVWQNLDKLVKKLYHKTLDK